MIRFDKVTLRYPGQDTPALDSLDLAIHAGTLTAVVGPSGSGKSSMLRCINRLVRPQSGTITVNGNPVDSLDEVTLRRATGYVIQDVGLFPHMSVGDNIGIVPSLLGWQRDRIVTRVDELLDLVRLPRAWAARMPHELSGGEAQRVGVARALAADPPLLLMDEPFGALDALTRTHLQTEFDAIRRSLGKTIIMVTHDLSEAFRLADRVVLMRDGRVAVEGTPGELVAGRGEPLVNEFLAGILALKRLVDIVETPG